MWSLTHDCCNIGFLPEKLLCSEGRRYSQAPDRCYWASFCRPLNNWSRSEHSASFLSLVNAFVIWCLILSLLPCLFSTYLETTLCFLVIISNNLYRFFFRMYIYPYHTCVIILASWCDEKLVISGVLVKFMMNGLRMKRGSGILLAYWRILLFHHLMMTQKYVLWIVES